MEQGGIQVVFLGTGTPNPDPKRSGPSLAVVTAGEAHLVDCGPGVVRRAAAAGFEMDQLSRVFLTHLHSDHTLGLPDLIFTPAVTGRVHGLSVWGPSGTRAMVEHILAAWNVDRTTRLSGSEPAVPAAYEVEVHEFEAGVIHASEELRVTAFQVEHGVFRPAFGFRFETQEGVIVVSGDTRPCEALIENAKGCDVMIHEAYCAAGLARRTPEWRAYHSSHHTSGIELGRIAGRVQPKLLLIHHALAFGETEERILEEVRQEFDGDVRLVADLETYRLP